MPIFIDNFSWISINIFLALLGVILSLFLSTRNKFLRICFFILWFLFVGNTIYLVTDLQYLPEQLAKVSFPEQITLIGEYIIVFLTGILTFFVSMHLFEKSLRKYTNKTTANALIVLMNYLIAFAVILGKIQRINSWYVFTNPKAVILAVFYLLSSKDLLLIIFLLGSIISVLYFSLKRILKVKERKVYRRKK